MISVKIIILPLCPGEYLIAVIDVSGRLWMKCYEVLPHGITETEGKQLHRLLSKRVKEWKAKINALIPTNRF